MNPVHSDATDTADKLVTWPMPLTEKPFPLYELTVNCIEVEGLCGLSGRLNSDGINCVSSRHVTVRNCFMCVCEDNQRAAHREEAT